jgi:hypothetical protein
MKVFVINLLPIQHANNVMMIFQESTETEDEEIIDDKVGHY